MLVDALVPLGENMASLRPVFQMAQAFLFFGLLFMVSVWDIRHRIIPDRLQAGIAALALLDFSVGNILGLLCMFPYLVIGLIPGKSDGIGGGDIKLAGSTGLILGLPAGLTASLVGLTTFIVYGLKQAEIGNRLLNMKKRVLFFICMAVPVMACVAFYRRRRHYIVRR